ncbi:MAG: DUF2341 domain-containing protein [Patescibacteria group bacterium]|nr:DUF2341 domain-containing protein [Patescibacteria group bacterium]
MIIAFYLFAIGGFIVVLNKSLQATGNDNVATVNFYANASRVEEAGNSWTGIDRVLGAPQVTDSGEAGDFNSDNSVIYSGGRQSLIGENFTTQDFIKNSAPTMAQSTSTPQPVLENNISTTTEQNIFASSSEPAIPAAIISSSTAGTQDFAFLPATSSSANNSGEQNISPVPPDNSALADPASIVPDNGASSPAVSAESESAAQTPSAPPADDSPASAAESAAPSSADNPSAAPTNETPPAEAQNHLPDSAPAPGEPSQAAESRAESDNSGGPISWLKELKNILAISKKQIGETLLGRLALAASQWGSNADDRNILFGPFKSAQIKVSIAAIERAVDENSAATSSGAIVPPAAGSTSTSASMENNANDQPAAAADQAAGGENSAASSSVNSDSSAGVIQKLLDFFAPDPAGAQENDPAAPGAPITIWYSFADEGGGNVWRELGTIDANSLANAERGGYLVFDAPFLNDWRDLDNLRLKFAGSAPAGGNFQAYLDSVWVEIAYQNGAEKVPDRPKNTDKDKLNIDGREINFIWTDNNSNENLIIKSDQKKYFGLTNAQMYFSVENTGVRNEDIKFQFYFPAASSSVIKLNELVPHSPYLTEVPKYEAQIYDCANGWDKRENIWTCYPSLEQRACDEVSPNRRYCRINGVMTGTEEKIQYADRWQEVGLDGEAIAPQEGLLQRLLGLGPQVKQIPDNFKNSQATAASVTIAPGEVKYFKASLGFPANSEGEFYIEAIGNNSGYGLLDPWWNSGWNYRLPITIDNSGNDGTLADYQFYLEISSSTSRDFWRNIKSDGSDIRFTNSEQTTELPYWVQSFDYTASSAAIWIKVDSIPAATTSKIYLYYGNGGASTASDQFTPFTYSSLQNIFYTASSSAAKTINVVSLIDNNQVQLDNGTAVNLSRQQTAVFTGFASTSVIKAKGPIMAKLSGSAGLESAIPISFAGTDFAIPSNRNLENFNFYAPFAAASTSLYDGATLKQTHSVNQDSVWATTQDIATDSIAVISSDQPVLFSFANSGPGDSLLGYPATSRDLYGVKSRYNLIGASVVSSFSIFCSSNSSTTISALAVGALQPNQICLGGVKGAGDAVRLGGISGAINAIQQDEGTSSESAIFLPFKEFSSEYMLPTNAAHIAVVCAPEEGVVALSVYDQNNNFVSSSTCVGSGDYPGKAYFGAADSETYLAGSRIVSTGGQPFYAYYKDTTSGGGETNLFGAVQTRNYSAPDPSYAFGAQQIEGPPTGSINSAAEKSDRSGRVNVSIAVNDLSRDDCRAKIEYVEQAGGQCDFDSPLKPLLDESSISADFGAPIITNANSYQIGTTSGWISTASGTNNILFDWLSKNDLPAADGTYCLRLTANDNISDQTTPATTTVVIDNAAPAVPGDLTLDSKTGTSVTLKFAATSTDSHFKEYRIYYKQYDGTPVNTAGTLFGSSSDINLADENFNRATTTTITGLITGLKYTFNLFAYDTLGNLASSTTGVDATANDAPTASFNSAAEKTDGSGTVDISFTADDVDHDNTVRAKLEYQAGSQCDFSTSSLATIDGNNLTATFGTVHRDNDETYRLGTTSYYILTSLGENTINFDWLSATDVPTASGTYCLLLTANDGVDDQLSSSTMVVVLDNIKPTTAGNLLIGSSTETSLELLLPTAHLAQDNNEPAAAAYKIFYKAGTAGVSTSDTPFTSSALDAYDFNGSSSVIVAGLSPDTHYVFNLWAYDSFGNKASSTEVTGRTDADLTNKSLLFIDPETTGTTTNIAVADNSSAWNFRAKVSDVDGYAAISDVTLRLADELDNSPPFDDLKFTWTRSTGAFAETGADANSASSLSGLSTSTCAANSCTVDFKIIFANTFATSSVDYSGELYSTDASLRTAEDVFDNLFQIRKSWLDQRHYRWRNDNGSG